MQEKARFESFIASGNQTTQDYNSLKKTLLQTRQGVNRSEKMTKFELLRQQEKEIDQQLETMKMNDPEQILIIQKQIKSNIDSANRWTDNIWGLKKYLTKKRGMSGKEVDKQLCIDSSFDYLMTDAKALQ